MVEKEKDVIGFAHKVISFRMNIIKACKARGVEPPTDEQISDYINGYGINLNDFMADYTEHEGIFRNLQTPFEQFSKAVAEISWSVAPTKEEIKAFFEKYGNNIELFRNQRILARMGSIERKTYLKTLDLLRIQKLVWLWNTFIEESGLYGADNYIYNLTKTGDMAFLAQRMERKEYLEVCKLKENGVSFIQWFSLGDNSIKTLETQTIKDIILAFWGEIFERIMLYPSCYGFNVDIYSEGDASTYFDDVFFPIIAKEVGYIVNGDKGTIEKVEKK
jgi:hypothetical protein